MWWMGLLIALVIGFLLGMFAWEGYHSEPFQTFLNQIFHPELKGATVTINSTLNSITVEKVRIDSLETVIQDGTTFPPTPETARENAIFLIISLNMTNTDTHPVSILNNTSNWKLYSEEGSYYELGTTDIPTENDSLQLTIPSKISVIHKAGFEVPMSESMNYTLQITEIAEPTPEPPVDEEQEPPVDEEPEPTTEITTDQTEDIVSNSTSIIKPELNFTEIKFNSTDKIVKELENKIIFDNFKNYSGVYADKKLKIEIIKPDPNVWSVKSNITQSSLQDSLTNYSSYQGSILITKDNSTDVSVLVFEIKNINNTISNLIDWELNEMMNNTDLTELTWSISNDMNFGKLNLKSDALHTEETQRLLKTTDKIYSIHSLVNTTESIDEQFTKNLEEIIARIILVR